MKTLKYTVVILLVLAVVAAVVHLYRESVVRKIANSALSGLGISATELSVQTIGTSSIHLSHLVLEQDDGTLYEISELTFPLTFPSERAETISIEQLVMTPAAAETAPGPLAPLLRTLLQLPAKVPNTEVVVGRLATPGFPPAHDVVWRTEGSRQELALWVDSIDFGVEVAVEIERVADDLHRATVNAKVDGEADALSLAMDIQGGEGALSADGNAEISASRWLPVLESIGMLPADVVALDAELAGPISIELGQDGPGSARAGARLSFADELTARYRASDDLTVRLRGKSSEPLSADLAYPSLEWAARIERIDVHVDTDLLGDIPMQLGDLECRSGIRCAVHAAVDTGPVKLESVAVANAKLTTRDTVAQLFIDDGGWRIDVDRLDLVVDGLTNRNGLLASGPVQLTTLRVRDGGAAIDTEVALQPKAANLSWDGTGIVVPGIAGNVSLRDGRVSAALELADGDALSGRVDAAHDVTTGTGTIAVRDAMLRFASGPLSGRLVQWPYAWDVVAGNWSADLDLDWQTSDDGAQYAGTLRQRADELAGSYNDTAFTGLNTTLTTELDSNAGMSAAPTALEVALIDVGLPLERIAAKVALDIDHQAIQVDDLSLSTLGGQIVADPFRFSLEEPRNDITLRPRSIQLPFIMKLVDFADIELTGSISGVIPVSIQDMQLTITNGRLESDPPGGAIRYRPGNAPVDSASSTSPLDLVSVALANFQFDSLTSDVNYNESGDLLLQMKLSGINPDMDNKQPVILNLGIDNNIPQLLRSLRATRSIEEILARKTAN